MSDVERQRLNVRTIRVTLEAARRHGPPDQVDARVGRARQLLVQALEQATAPALVAEIEALQAELDRADAAADQREG